MNKILKTLFSVLFAVLVMSAVPGAMAGFDSINTNDVTITDNADTVTFRFNADSGDAIDNVLVTATQDVDNGEEDTGIEYEATVYVDIPQAYGVSVPATFTTESLGINGIGTYTITVALDAPVDEVEDITVHVVESDPEADYELLPGLISEVDLEEDELTYGDMIEFEIELETEGEQRISDMTVEIEFNGDTIETREFKMFGDDDDNVELTLDQDDFKTELSIDTSVDEIDEGDYDFTVRVYGSEEVNADGDAGWQLHNHLLDTYTIQNGISVEKLDDNLAINDVDFDQQANVLYTAILVENIGQNNAEGVRAQVRIDGIELNPIPRSNTITVYEDDDAIMYLPVSLPAFSTGEYDITVTIYNDDVSVSETIEAVELIGVVAQTNQPQTGLVISLDSAVKTVPATGAVYALTFTNNGATARTISIEAAGADWGQTSVNPGTIVVGAQSSEIASVFVAPTTGEQGVKQFTLFIKEGNQIIKFNRRNRGEKIPILRIPHLEWDHDYLYFLQNQF